MTTEKQTVHRLYTSGSADFLDSEGGRNTRGGRAYREPSDSDLDPYWNDSRALALSDAHKAINRAGIARVRDVLRESNRTTE